MMAATNKTTSEAEAEKGGNFLYNFEQIPFLNQIDTDITYNP